MRNADVRSDLLAGLHVFHAHRTPSISGGNGFAETAAAPGDEPPDVRQLRPDLPEEVSRVRKMMAKEPRRRYQDPAKLIMGLLVLAELAGLQRVGPGQTVGCPREPEVTFLERHLPWLPDCRPWRHRASAAPGLVLWFDQRPANDPFGCCAGLAPEVPIEGLLPDDDNVRSEMANDHAGPPPGSRFSLSNRTHGQFRQQLRRLICILAESEKPESPTPNSRSLPPPQRLGLPPPTRRRDIVHDHVDEGLV